MITGKTWTTQEEHRLLELAAAGMTHKQIGAELGRSKHAVSCRLSRIRRASGDFAPRHRWRTGDIAKLRELYLKNLTGREIAEVLGVTANAVHNKLAELRRRGELYIK